MSKSDREAAKRDYEAGMSIRAIALKYGVGKSTVHDWAKRGGWKAGQPDGQNGQPDGIALSEIPPAGNVRQRIEKMGNRLLDRVGEVLEGELNVRDLRGLAATLLDVRQLLNAVSAVEAEEQRLRIAALQRQLEAETTSEPVTIRFVNTEGAER